MVILMIEATGLASASSLSFIISHINLLVLRRRLPKAPRTFKVPLGPIIPLVGIVGMVYMVANISTDLAQLPAA